MKVVVDMNSHAERLLIAVDGKGPVSTAQREFIQNAESLLHEASQIRQGSAARSVEVFMDIVRQTRDLVVHLEFARSGEGHSVIVGDGQVVGSRSLANAAESLLGAAVNVVQFADEDYLLADFELVTDGEFESVWAFVQSNPVRYGTGEVLRYVDVARGVAAASYALRVWGDVVDAQAQELAVMFAEAVASLDPSRGGMMLIPESGVGTSIGSPTEAGLSILNVVSGQTDVPHVGWIPVTVYLDDASSINFPDGEEAWLAVEGIDGPAQIRFDDGSLAVFAIENDPTRDDDELSPSSPPDEAKRPRALVADLVTLEVENSPSEVSIDTFQAQVEPLIRRVYLAIENGRFPEPLLSRVERDIEYLRREVFETDHDEWLGDALGAIVARLERDLLAVVQLPAETSQVAEMLIAAIAADQPSEIAHVVDQTLAVARLDDSDWLLAQPELVERYAGQLDLIVALGAARWISEAVGWLGQPNHRESRGGAMGGVVGLLVAAISKATAADSLTVGVFVGPFVAWVAGRYKNKR